MERIAFGVMIAGLIVSTAVTVAAFGFAGWVIYRVLEHFGIV